MNQTHNAPPTGHYLLRPKKSLWLGLSLVLLVIIFISELIIVALLNDGWVNHVRTPVVTYFSLFPLFWMEEPLAALEFISTKSIIMFANHDVRSDLNIWTLEYDLITLLVYSFSALLSGWLITNYYAIAKKKLIIPLAGTGILVFTFTYMTAVEHCAGATWVGFVSLYGLGISGFDIYPYYQVVFASTGLVLLGLGMYRLKTTR